MKKIIARAGKFAAAFKSQVFLSIAVVAALTGLAFSTTTIFQLDKNIADSKEDSRPANVRIVKITTPNCKDCFDVEKAVADFKKQNVKVEDEKTISLDSPEASASIKELDIKKVPTFIATGEVFKDNLSGYVKAGGEIKNNTFIFTKLTPLYLDPETLEEQGWVTALIITDPSCAKCLDMKSTVEGFRKAGVKIKEIRESLWNSYDGQNTIAKYKLTKVPAFLLSPEFDLYESAKATWSNFGTVENDKAFVARNIPLPYRDPATGRITGLVDLIYLTDSTCPDCYKVAELQRPIITQGYNVALSSERTVDALSGEGQSLIARYKIDKIPTIILSPSAADYQALKSVWSSVGKIGDDGWYVFTGFPQLGNIVYKDLTENRIIRPAQPSPLPQGQ